MALSNRVGNIPPISFSAYEAGNVVGGETFQFNEGWVAINPPITIDPIVIGDGMIMLNAAVPEDNVSVNWTDETDSRIGRGSNITVKPTRHNDTFTVTVFNDKGEMFGKEA